MLSNGCNLEHYSLIGEVWNEDLVLDPGGQDILVNLEQLAQLMKIAGVVHE